jgi:hypothetical protein
MSALIVMSAALISGYGFGPEAFAPTTTVLIGGSFQRS